MWSVGMIHAAGFEYTFVYFQASFKVSSVLPCVLLSTNFPNAESSAAATLSWGGGGGGAKVKTKPHRWV